MFRSPKLLSATLLSILSLLVLAAGCSHESNPFTPAAEGETVSPLPFPSSSAIGDRGKPGGNIQIGDGIEAGDAMVLETETWVSPRWGGQMTLDFFTLDVPSRAVSKYTLLDGALDDEALATVELGPDGQQFNKPVQLSFALAPFEDYLDENDIAVEDLVVALYDEDGGEWNALASTLVYEGGVAVAVTAETTHFSRYALSD